MNKKQLFLILALALAGLFACHKEEISPKEELSGGETTIFSSGPDAYTFPSANLDEADLSKHFLADAAFGQQFVSAPAQQFGGIGPLFNQNSCESCHVRNGRGAVPQYEGDLSSGLLLRISMPGAGPDGRIVPVPGFGGQLQNKAIFGVAPEGKISRSEIDKIVTFIDGTQIALTKPVYTIKEPYINLPVGILISPRVAPPVFGLGLLEAIPEEAILALADENDDNNDGISGKPNNVWDVLKQNIALGRFGWKAEQPTAEQQSADAAHNDMGLTSFYFETEQCAGQENCQEGLQNSNDVDNETINLFTYYFQTLGVPAARNVLDAEVTKGKQLFEQAKCAACHVPKHTTGSHPIAALAYQTIYPYTDMLLHDMGEELADHRPTFTASGQEWRTSPLWGIGLARIVNPKATYLHDGRAKNLEEAILWHGGEANSSKEYYLSLSKKDRDALLAFLNNL